LIASAVPVRTSAFDLATTSGSILNIGTDLSAVDEDEMGGAEHCSPSGNSKMSCEPSDWHSWHRVSCSRTTPGSHSWLAMVTAEEVSRW
jgi:hypothetical protein